jgi:hypothetical protein
MGMNLHPQTRLISLSAIAAGLLMLGGCAQSHPSAAWQGSGMHVGNAGNRSAVVFSPALEGTGTLVYTDRNAPEYSRRDFTMSARDLSRRDELFGVRAQEHPSLNNRRLYRSSRRADEYSYPSSEPRGYQGYRRYYRDR